MEILRNAQEDCFGKLKAEPFLASLFLVPFASYLKGFSQYRGMTLSVFWKVLQGGGGVGGSLTRFTNGYQIFIKV